MSLFDDFGFNRLQDSINSLMGDFGRGGGRRPQRRGVDWMGGDIGFSDPFFGWGYDPFLVDPSIPLLTGGERRGGGGGGMGPSSSTGGGGDDNKMDDSSSALTTQQQGGQVGLRQGVQLPVLRCRVNVEEQADKYVVTAEVPAFDKENLKLNINDNNVLTISGEQKKEHVEESKDKRYLRRERTFGTVQRSLQLPRNVNKEAVAAKYENGVLHINIPKLEKKEAKSDIQIS